MGWSQRWQYRSMYLTRDGARGGGERPRHRIGALFHAQHLRRSRPDRFLPGNALAIEEGRDVFRERELLIGTFGRLFQRHGSGGGRIAPTPSDRAVLAKVKERMHADYASDLHLEDLAAGAGLTTFQLIGLFKRTVGLTPHAYLTQIRLAMACRHLRRSPALAEAATAVGFYDQSALTKHFKRCYGITPLQFARAAAA